MNSHSIETLLSPKSTKIRTLKVKQWHYKKRFSPMLKRTVDLVGSGMALIVLSPVMLTTALLVKLQDGGPIIFKQERVGKEGKIFKMLKFRSMIVSAEKQKTSLQKLNKHGSLSVTFKAKEDPRVTYVGRFIRKYSIDELPQFINVLKGEMSLVGPRPAVVNEVIQYKSDHLVRLLPKPGISCYWQVSGRADIDFEGQVALDKKYRRKAGFITDSVILLKTIPAVLSGKGSY